MLGMKKEPIIEHFLTQMPVKFSVEMYGPFIMTGAVIEVDAVTGRAIGIERVRVQDDTLVVDENADDGIGDGSDQLDPVRLARSSRILAVSITWPSLRINLLSME